MKGFREGVHEDGFAGRVCDGENRVSGGVVNGDAGTSEIEVDEEQCRHEEGG